MPRFRRRHRPRKLRLPPPHRRQANLGRSVLLAAKEAIADRARNEDLALSAVPSLNAASSAPINVAANVQAAATAVETEADLRFGAGKVRAPAGARPS